MSPLVPDALRTHEWAMKTLNTQLASWTELRHDTVLYVKQPYTAGIICSYPAGFIEPRVAFWERMRDLALDTKALLYSLPKTGTFVFEPNSPAGSPTTNSLGAIYTNRMQFLDRFASHMSTLAEISAKELRREALSSNETYFIQSLIDDPSRYAQRAHVYRLVPAALFPEHPRLELGHLAL